MNAGLESTDYSTLTLVVQYFNTNGGQLCVHMHYTCQKVHSIFRTFINLTLENNTVKRASLELLSTEVTQSVKGHAYLTPLYSSGHLERKRRETKGYHIRETTVITQSHGTEENLGVSNFDNVSFKLK